MQRPETGACRTPLGGLSPVTILAPGRGPCQVLLVLVLSVARCAFHQEAGFLLWSLALVRDPILACHVGGWMKA